MGNDEIIAQGQKYLMNNYGRFPVALVRGEGCRVWDADGKEYLDFTSGIAVCGLGHSPPILKQVLEEQAGRLWHCSNLYWIQPQVELAAKLCRLSGLGKAFFANSGAEVNEAAFKLTRKYFSLRGRPGCEIIAFRNSFHGRTFAALTATGQEKYHYGFEPLVPGFMYADFNDLKSVEQLITERTGAVIVEPIQGEGGVNPATEEFLTGLRRLCDEAGLLLIFDEVQTGLGRTGKMFAGEHYGVSPDIMTVAKSLGGGFPIGAMLARAEVAEAFQPGDHASTFGGNPLGCAVASRFLDIVSDPEVLRRVGEIGDFFKKRLQSMTSGRQDVKEVRGLGLLLGVEFTREVRPLVEKCMQRGLLVISAGPQVLRLAPPLNVTFEEAEAGLAVLEEALREWAEA